MLRRSRRLSIVVHGGAWAIPQHLTQASLDGVGRAARVGWAVLHEGSSALEAAEAAVRVLEEEEAFDAGKGAVLTSAGEVELDASIMDGKDMKAGAVAAIGPVLHPVSVARMVMERTPHVMIVGSGATEFARSNGVPILSPDELVTPAAREEWQQMQRFPNSVNTFFRGKGVDTVGAVAFDADGNLAAATSTGGISCKLPGRVGDSPIVGGGVYADNEAGAVSCTGHGEAIMRVCLAQRVTQLMQQGEAPGAACASALSYMRGRVDGYGGLISIDPSGRVGLSFSTERMAWAAITSDGTEGGALRSGIERQDDGGASTTLEFAPASSGES